MGIWRQSGDFDGLSGARISWRFAMQKVAIFALLLKTAKNWRFLGKSWRFSGSFSTTFSFLRWGNLRERLLEIRNLASKVWYLDASFCSCQLEIIKIRHFIYPKCLLKVVKRGDFSGKFGEKWRFKGLIWRESGDFPMHFWSGVAPKVAIL